MSCLLLNILQSNTAVTGLVYV